MNNQSSMGRLLLCFVLCCWGTLASLQAQVVSKTFEEKPLKTVLKEIEEQSGLSIIYNVKEVDENKPVSGSFKNAQVLDVLKQILDADLDVELQNKMIVIKKKNAPAQSGKTITVKGNVVDNTGLPVIGSSVVVKGTTNGLITDIDGNYILTNVPEDAVVAISYIGYQTIELKANSKELAHITLKEDSEMLEEVVVVGYGVQKKSDVSVSVASVKADALANNPASDFRQALVGKMPGVQVTTPSGDPEGSVSIRVRGVSTVNAGSDPLYIVDGVPMERGFANLNSNDIESIEVLKDASAAAIYGSRGSNGVVLVTTKKGTSEKLTVQYDGYYGIQSVSKKLDMMNAYQYAEFVRDGHNNAYLAEVPGASPDDPNSVRPKSYHQIPVDLFPYLEGKQGLTDTDWQDEIFRTAGTTGHSLSLSGKTQSVNYFVSANYMEKKNAYEELQVLNLSI